MKPLILIMAMVCAMASCSKKPQSASLDPVSTLDTICADTLHTDTLHTDTTSTDSLPATSSTAATSASTSSFNGVSSRNSYGAAEILGFDDDVDDDNDMDAFMNDYRDDF